MNLKQSPPQLYHIIDLCAISSVSSGFCLQFPTIQFATLNPDTVVSRVSTMPQRYVFVAAY